MSDPSKLNPHTRALATARTRSEETEPAEPLPPSGSTARSSGSTSALPTRSSPRQSTSCWRTRAATRCSRPAQEIELAKRIERGDLHAKELLVNSNLRLVASNARRYQNQGLPLGDLVQEGMLGLIRASEKFDWRKGFRFSTYATLWIRQAIQRGLENSGRTIRLPVHVAQRSRKVGRVERELSVRLGREPTLEELAQETGLPIEQVEEVRHQRAALVSLDQQIGEDGDTALGDLLPSDAEAPEETAWDNERERIVHRAISAAARNRAHGADAALRHRPRGAADADRNRQTARLLRRAGLAARAARAEEARRVSGARGTARGRVAHSRGPYRPAGHSAGSFFAASGSGAAIPAGAGRDQGHLYPPATKPRCSGVPRPVT